MKDSGQTRRAAFSLVELLVVIAIVSILASRLLPVLTRAKVSADGIRCKNNLRQLALALQMYVTDHGVFPYWIFPNSSSRTNQ